MSAELNCISTFWEVKRYEIVWTSYVFSWIAGKDVTFTHDHHTVLVCAS
jgi:hypothetical protein